MINYTNKLIVNLIGSMQTFSWMQIFDLTLLLLNEFVLLFSFSDLKLSYAMYCDKFIFEL